MKKELLKIGVVVKTQGLKGEVKIGLSSEVEIIPPLTLDLLFYTQQNTFLPLQVETFVHNANFLLVKFKGWNSINDVQFLKGKEIFVPVINSSWRLKTNWIDYLVMVGEIKAKVIDVMNNGIQDLIKIQFQEKQFWVPIVETFVAKINDDQKIIYLQNLEGLM